MKKFLLLLGIAAFGALCVVMYWSQHLYYKAQNTESMEERVAILRKARKIYPFNPGIDYALGEAHLSAGAQIPGELEEREAHFEGAVSYYKKALGKNPVSAFSHFGLAQAYYNMSFFSPILAGDSFREYKNAALLAGHHTPIFFKVGKLFLSRWEELDEESRDFTVTLLKRIVESADSEKFRQMMQVWEMSVKDYEVMERILPEKSWVFKMYARYLGERSLSVEERQRFLAEAELLDFKQAREEHERGENDYFTYQMESAYSRFQRCLDVLSRVHFFQRLTNQSLIDPEEFNEVQKSAHLYLVKSGLAAGRGFDEVEGDLMAYLSREDKVIAVREVDEFLQKYGIIREKLERNFEDMGLFSFQVYLAFRENRYRDIMRIGRDFKQSFVMVPEKDRADYVRILQIVGDANQKVDFIYDAVEFYEQALELDPDNLETLLRLRHSLMRLNKDEEREEVEKRIDEVVSEQVKEWEGRRIEKGQDFQQTLVLDGSDVVLSLEFEGEEGSEAPLVSVFWNGKVVWEDYGSGVLSFPVKSGVGENRLSVRPVNRAVRILRLGWQREKD